MTNRLSQAASGFSQAPPDIVSKIRLKAETTMHALRSLLNDGRPYQKDDPRHEAGSRLIGSLHEISILVEKCHFAAQAKNLENGAPDDEQQAAEAINTLTNWKDVDIAAVTKAFSWRYIQNIQDCVSIARELMNSVKQREIEIDSSHPASGSAEAVRDEAMFQTFFKGAVKGRNLKANPFDYVRIDETLKVGSPSPPRMRSEDFFSSFRQNRGYGPAAENS